MGRFTGWLALIVILGGLGYVMYEDLKLRREQSAVSAEAPAVEPVDVVAVDAAVPPPPAAARPPPADASQVPVGPSDAPEPAGERAVAAADTTAPTDAGDTPAQAASDSATPSGAPDAASEAEAAGSPDEPVQAGAAPGVAPEVAPDAAPSPAESASAATPPAESEVLDEETAVSEAVTATPEAMAPEPEAAVAEPEAPPAPATEADEPAAVADATVLSDEGADGTKVPPQAPEETRATAAPDEPVPAGTVEADASPPGRDAGGTQVVAAPEGAPGAPDGGGDPVSESSGLDRSLQAAPTPEAEPGTVIAAVDPDADVDGRAPAEPTPLQPGVETETAAAPPTFDIVRVEPSGDAVIAGVAPPNAEIAIVSGANTLARATADPTGEWVIALEEPLPAGQYDLAIRATTDDGATSVSDQRVAVLVPEAEEEEPLVILNTPDGPSMVLQVPAAPEPSAPAVSDAGAATIDGTSAPAIADATASGSPTQDADGAVAPAAADAASPSPAPATIAEVEPTAPEPDGTVPPAVSGAPVVPEAAPAQPEVAALEPEPTPPAGAESAVAPEPVAPAVITEAPATTDADEEAAVGSETAVAVEPEPAPEPEPIVPVVVVTAVEAETSGALFIAGTAITPEVVRVYLDDLLLGEATPSPSGTWLLEVQRELPAGTYDVRADQVESGSGTVVARAEVPFEREVDVAILTPVAEAGGPAGAVATGTLSGPTTVIIKRRDNLWRISRQLYGKGVRWSTIYQANKDQIRNPRWIYPGQVFILPQGNVEWSDGDVRAAAE
jgi:nucleoid-associated protein YgaU